FAAPKQPYPSGGVNPIRAVVATAGKYLYVLNAGCGGTSQVACPAGANPNQTGANISLFTVGGQGSLSFQASYFSQGSLPVSIVADAAGKYLYVLDSIVPDPTTCTGYVKSNPASVCGDITAFNIDPNTGRLSLITNQQVKNSAGTNLTYFPIGSGPIEFSIYNSSFIYTIEKGSGSNADPYQAVFVYALADTTGQLTLTQNTPIPSNGRNLTYVYSSPKYVYLLDAGDGTTAGTILPYTSSTNGALQSLVGGAVANTGTTANPVAMLVDHNGNFAYIANKGPNLSPTSPASTVSAFFITPNTGLLQPLTSGTASNGVPFGSGSGPRCILEDPTNQYLYTANYDSSTVTGALLNEQAGTLTNLRKDSSFPTVGQPTWCAASGTLF
ncbi:MAG TPA: beta-propeller fold lactonase family protein, partial [Acidobacteriaceae bacterium]|nr:beta-propeller fold lactonase family protein [Acidobacteriaceae bacterium]